MEELPEAYHGAAYEVTDTVFLMDEMQIYNMWKNFGDIKAILGEKGVSAFSEPGEYTEYFSSYCIKR